MFVCLLPYKEGRIRIPKECRQNEEVCRWYFPRPPWLQELCATLPAKLELPPVVVEVCGGHVYQGDLLTPWDREGMTLFEHYGRPYDAMTLEVLWFQKLDPSTRTMTMDATQERPQLAQTVVCLPVPLTCVRDGNELKISLGWYFPDILVALITQRRWRHLLLRQSWMARRMQYAASLRDALASVDSNWPPQEWVARLKEQHLLTALVPPPSVQPLGPECALAASEFLRKHASNLLAVQGEETKFEIMANLSEVLNHLQIQAGTTKTAGSLHSHAQSPQRRSVFSADRLAKALSMTMHLKGRAHLRTVIAKSLSLVGGTSMSIDSLQAILQSEPIPSAASLSRAQVLMDAAWCCVWRQELQASDGPLFLWADSSPQAGEDYLLSTLMGIDGASIVPAFRASQALSRLSSESPPLTEMSESDAIALIHLRHSWSQQLSGKWWYHRQIPCAIGVGSIEHKCKAIIHKFRVECLNEHSHLPSVLARVRAICVDMGVEQSLARMQGLSHQDFPAHPSDDEMESEVPKPAWASSLGVPGPEDGVLPHALLSTGMCHIAHNMTAEVFVGLRCHS